MNNSLWTVAKQKLQLMFFFKFFYFKIFLFYFWAIYSVSLVFILFYFFLGGEGGGQIGLILRNLP